MTRPARVIAALGLLGARRARLRGDVKAAGLR